MDLRAVVASQVTDLQDRLVSTGDLGGLAAHLLIICNQHQALFIEVLARRRQHELPVVPLQQRKSQFIFQCFDLLGDGGLRDIALLRRFGKAVVAHYGLEITNLAEHDRTLPPCFDVS